MIIHTTTLDTKEKVIAIYGGKTWVKIEGKFLLGTSSTHAINSTGGSETHTLTEQEIPIHKHGISNNVLYTSGSTTELAFTNTAGSSYQYYLNTTNATYNAGAGYAHNNMPPYKTVYIWERTA